MPLINFKVNNNEQIIDVSYDGSITSRDFILDFTSKYASISSTDRNLYVFKYRGKILNLPRFLDKKLQELIENDSTVTFLKEQEMHYSGGPAPENSDYSTSINAVNKRDNIGNEYYYKIKGSNEGTVWGDHIYTDDSNIAKAAVLEGKCELGQEIILGIKIIEGKNNYSCASKNGVSSVTYGSWPASYIFI